VATIDLGNSVSIPQLGFGVFQVPPEETKQAVLTALETGYRHIDTAAMYRNEAGVGEAIREFGIDRDELFITTKLVNDDHGRQKVAGAMDASLKRLGLDYVDLYLIHWPCPTQNLYVETWEAMQSLVEKSQARSVGVSNFRIEDLDRLAREGLPTPPINQVELHPWLVQQQLRSYHDEHNIVTEAWSPLAKADVLADPTITELAETNDATPAQVVLAWHLALGNVVIPKSVTPSRVQENFAATGVTLTQDEVTAVSALDRGERTGPDPAEMG